MVWREEDGRCVLVWEVAGRAKRKVATQAFVLCVQCELGSRKAKAWRARQLTGRADVFSAGTSLVVGCLSSCLGACYAKGFVS